MRKLIKNYIESYWWYFFGQAIVMIAFGLLALVAPTLTFSSIIAIAAIALILMGLVGITRMVQDYTRRPHRRWGDSLVIAIIELVVGFYFLFNLNAGFQITAIVFGFLVLIRGIFDLIVALFNVKDSIDRFFWIVAGIAGIVIGIVILNHPMGASEMMIMFFGLYVLVLGLSNLFYALHLKTNPAVAEQHARTKTTSLKKAMASGTRKVRAKVNKPRAAKTAKKSGAKK